MDKGLRLAITAAGSKGQLARALGLTRQALTPWRQVPLRHLLAIERITKVPRELLRPDLYRGPIK